jgi:hypothetical protein
MLKLQRRGLKGSQGGSASRGRSQRLVEGNLVQEIEKNYLGRIIEAQANYIQLYKYNILIVIKTRLSL